MVYSLIMTSRELKKWREKNGFSQNQLARALGVFNITISRWENDVRKVPSFLHWALVGLESTGKRGDDFKPGVKSKKGGKA
jgi:hypothetical protein